MLEQMKLHELAADVADVSEQLLLTCERNACELVPECIGITGAMLGPVERGVDVREHAVGVGVDAMAAHTVEEAGREVRLPVLGHRLVDPKRGKVRRAERPPGERGGGDGCAADGGVCAIRQRAVRERERNIVVAVE